MKRGLCLLMLMALGVGCVAPQRPGTERTVFLSMATSSGAVAGAIGAAVTCSIARYGFAHRPPSKTDGVETVCLLTGAVAGAAVTYLGSSESEEAPGIGGWAAVSLGSAAAAAIVTAFVIELFD